LEYLSECDLLSDDALIIVEASLETDMSYAPELGLSIVKEKLYKTNKHVFLEREA
jgi:16S rRNA (guanine966-N2)-methyltransferase